MFRKSVIKTIGITAGTITLYTILLMDTHLRWIFETVASRINGAEVEAHSLKTNLLRGTFHINQLHISNPFNPSENLAQIEKISGQLLIGPLLRRKLVIDHLDIIGTRLFVERANFAGNAFDTSSIFERQAPGFSSPVLSRISESPLRLLGQVTTGIEIRGKLEGSQSRLSSQQRLEELKHDIVTLSKIKEELMVESNSKTVSDLSIRLQTLKSQRSVAAEDSWALLQRDVTQAMTPVSVLIEQAQRKFHRMHENLESLIPFIEADVAELKSQMRLPRLNLDDLSTELFSPPVMHVLDRLSYWLDMSRRRMPTGSKTVVRQELSRGSAIHFGKDGGWPALVIRRIGLVPVQAKSHDIVTGTLTGITSDPPLYGSPCTLNLEINSPGSQIENLRLDIVIDHRLSEPRETLDISFSSLPIRELALNESYDLKFLLRSAKVKGTARLVVQENNLKLDWNTTVQNAEYTVASRHRQIQTTIEQAAKPIQSFTVSGKAEGPFADIQFSIRSELGKAVADAIRRDFRHSIAAIDDTLKSELLDHFDPKRRSLQYELSMLEKSVIGELEDRLLALKGIASIVHHRAKTRSTSAKSGS